MKKINTSDILKISFVYIVKLFVSVYKKGYMIMRNLKKNDIHCENETQLILRAKQGDVYARNLLIEKNISVYLFFF